MTCGKHSTPILTERCSLHPPVEARAHALIGTDDNAPGGRRVVHLRGGPAVAGCIDLLRFGASQSIYGIDRPAIAIR